MLVRYSSAHPYGGQIFFPRDGPPFVALLTASGHDVKPLDFRAFHCDGKFSIHIKAGVWHAAMLPLADRAVFNNRQGRVHASIACDSVEEFNLYFSVLLPPMS